MEEPSASELLVERAGSVLHVTFNRPRKRNAMTWAMYDGLVSACEVADSDPDVRVLVFRGAGDEAFVAGTDIAQFRALATGADGVAYEKKITDVLDRLETVRVPTVAAVAGHCLGAGLAIAAACDVRIAADTALFGVPIAATLGNCLSMSTHALLVAQLGYARTSDLLLRARSLSAPEAHTAGFVSEVGPVAELDALVDAEVGRLATHAPLTMWATKESLRRLRNAALPNGDDIVSEVYGSADFHNGVEAFVGKQPHRWSGT